MSNEYLIEAEELADTLNDDRLYIVDTRDALEYNKGHLPGAINISEFFTYLCTSGSGGLPAMVRHFNSWLGFAGLRFDHKVVIYEDAMDNGFGQSCRARFMLKYFGQADVRVLHGGYRAWMGRHMPITRTEPVMESSDYTAQIHPEEMLTTEQMRASLGDPDIVILDCRDRSEWLGVSSSPYVIDFCPRKGRIPGARWIEWYRTMVIKDGAPYFKSPEEILEVAGEIGITPESKIHLYCFKGARSSNMQVALQLAGINYVRNYFSAWNDWSRDPSLPIEEGYPDS